ncbi:DNA repair-scaffolding protein isoform X2 [Sphaeramia orbicularis]|nr:DNA repair-scaffolding protein isoform X2 [Sphaeramia orbicularis]
MLTTDKDDAPVIDTDSDVDEFEEEVDRDSGQHISDCESESSHEKQMDSPAKPSNVPELEISGYVSDGENVGDTMTCKLDSESSAHQTNEGTKRSVSDWVKSAQALLQTPQKLFNKQSKTPEDSAKKRRKFQSGGLAERLNRLQCRQRSAISFWRHKSTSNMSTTAVDRPGVLVLEVLEVQQECSMQLVHCEHHQPPREGHQHSQTPPEERPRLLVLFNRETAAQLVPAPKDVIHIYPPWQSLSVEGFSSAIILNTHFSQKVYSAPKSVDMSTPSLFSAKRIMPYSLDKTFGLLKENSTKQADVSEAVSCFRDSYVTPRHCQSLLEAIEGLGQAGSVGQAVEVVVQRVYSIPVPDCSPRSILKHRIPSRPSTAPPAEEKDKTRLCVLVQDSYGMFSVVQLHILPCGGHLQQYCHMWQGRTCLLRDIKVVQRVTRERHTRLFSLIDSLWPPLVPLKDHGNTPSSHSGSRPAGPAPSFCYLLSGVESSVEPTEGQDVPPLYLPPTPRNLQDILQSELKSYCCSFVATVIYKRMQKTNVGRGEIWLVLTDPSLQEEQVERPHRRTVALCVSASCVLTSSALKALNSTTACRMSFRDTIREHGVFLCVENSVVELCSEQPEVSFQSAAKPESLTEPETRSLAQPVLLDPLDLEITPHSLCTVTGVIVSVDENTAYSWPVCNHCGSDHLERLAQRQQNFHCVSCKSVVDKPMTRLQLEVFLSVSSLSNCTVKVKLQQKTIMSILNTTALQGHEFPGYDVENVLGKEVGPLTVYVQVITRKPALWIGLEEICL